MFDRDQDGLVTRQDINVVTRGLGLGLTQLELDRFMKIAGKVWIDYIALKYSMNNSN